MKAVILTLVICFLAQGEFVKQENSRVLAFVGRAQKTVQNLKVTATHKIAEFLRNPTWWTNAIIYQVQVSSFKDSDGDGVGDIKGLRQKLYYLKNLGVQAIQVVPPVTYPSYASGYDFTHARKIDPIYGNMSEMRDLINAAHQLGMHILVDFVPNRLSPEHDWFKRSVKKQDPYSNYFFWSPAVGHDEDGDPIPPSSWVDVNDRNLWIWNDERAEFYLAQANERLPVLRLGNPDLAAELMSNVKFWLDAGVDGLKVDALEFMCDERHLTKYIDLHPDWIVRERTKISLDKNYNLPDKCHLAKTFGDKVGEYIEADKKPRLILVDTFGGVDEQISHYGGKEINGDPRFMVPINIQLLENVNQGTQAPQLQELIESWLQNLQPGDVPNWIMASHDTGHLASKMGPEFVGPMNMLLLTLPGIALVGMGQEIGMQNTFIREDLSRDSYAKMVDGPAKLWQSRDPFRTPFQWDDTTSAGFSKNRVTWLPVNPNYYSLNVQAQESAQKSELKLFRAMAKLKQSAHALQHGRTQVFAPDPYILVVKRYVSAHPNYILVINTDLVLREAYISGYGPHPQGDSVKVVLASLNSDLKPGDQLEAPLYAIRLLPRSAVLLKTSSWRKKKRAVAKITSDTIVNA